MRLLSQDYDRQDVILHFLHAGGRAFSSIYQLKRLKREKIEKMEFKKFFSGKNIPAYGGKNSFQNSK